MYCKFCGKQIDDNAQFCQYCGKKLKQSGPSEPLRRLPGSKKKLLLLCCCVAAVLLVVAVIAAGGGNREETVSWSDSYQASSDREGKLESSEPPLASELALPDPEAYRGGAIRYLKSHDYNGYSLNSYSLSASDFELLSEYVQLLVLRGFSLRDSEQGESEMKACWVFDFTGTGSVSSFDVRKQKAVSVYLWAYYTPDTEFHVTYSEGLEYVDNGDRTTQTIQRRSEDENGSGGGSGNDDDDSAWKGNKTEIKCTKCHGEKTVSCGNCDGKGYKEKVVESPNFGGGVKRETVKEKCYKCSNGQIKCPRCHGTGKQ